MSNFLSSDVYEITQLIEDIKTRNMGGVSSCHEYIWLLLRNF